MKVKVLRSGKQILLTKQSRFRYEPKFYFYQSTKIQMQSSDSDVQPPLSEAPIPIRTEQQLGQVSVRPFLWTTRWLRGEEYGLMLERMEQYASQFGFEVCGPDQHPDEIYNQPANGTIYFMRNRNIRTLRFPRTSFHKRFRWKKLNFPTHLPKSAPIISYLVASCIDTNPLSPQSANRYRMHIVELTNGRGDLVLCHIRQMEGGDDRREETRMREGLGECFQGERPNLFRLFSFLHNMHGHLAFENDSSELIITMKGANLAQLLANTLNPSTTHSSYQALSEMRTSNGFAIQLLIISDNGNIDISIRQSSLIYLKNLLCQHIQQGNLVPSQDIQTLKGSLLQALIRNVTNQKLTPTFREIIYKLAERYYPRQWPEIVEAGVALVESGTDLGGLLGAVQALKAVYSVFGASVTKEIELNNLCNKSVLPILNLASKLFQNFNQQSSTVLVGIFKLLSTSIQFFLPQIIAMNIHSFMIFVKKILDLNADLTNNDNNNLYLLKKISLRILYRLYQRHANPKLTEYKQFAILFHQKYTRPFVETLVFQILIKVDGDRASRHRAMELIKLSLSCLACINRQNPEAATILLQHRDGMVRLCMQKFKISVSRNYHSFNDFKLYTHQARLHFKQFVLSLIVCQAIPEQQNQAVSSLLGLLLQYLQKGDNEQKDLALYLFSEISTQLKYLSQSLQQKMSMLLLQYVKPLLKEDQNLIIRARACQMISSYHYLQLPADQIGDLAMLIYSCLLVGNGQKEVFLKIYACNAFNSIMKYDSIVQFIRPYLQDILKIYTELLQTDLSIIKNFQDLINLLEQQISPYANDLVRLLISMFLKYTSDNPQASEQGYQNYKNQELDQDVEDEDSGEEDAQCNNEYTARASISSLRQIIQVSNVILAEDIQQQLLDIVVWIFADSNQNFIEEGYNILNLLLYKLRHQTDPKYFIFFRVIVYAILGMPVHYIDDLKRKGDNFSTKFAQILENICVEPDNDIIQNSIGCLRNFLVKTSGDFLRNQRDDFNLTYMDYILKLTTYVHQNQSQKASQTDRLIILTLYITSIEYQVVNQHQLGEIIRTITQWMQMEFQVVEAQRLSNGGANFKSFGKDIHNAKYIYTPVYLQILLLAINFYGKAAEEKINISILVQKVVLLEQHFKCDYELSRVIVGLSYILENKMLGDQNIVKMLMNSLPQFVRRLCKLRQEGDQPQNDLQMDDEAEEENLFGEDQNTHVMGWNNNKVTEKDMQLKNQEDDDDDSDWEQQFNKFYESPLDKMDELKYLEQVLKQGNIYISYMNQQNQQNLALYLANAPPKNAI